MSLAVLEGATLRFGARTIFDGLGLRIGTSDRIGLIGPNGSGKTTLLRVLARQQEIDAGELELANGTRVGYLPQELAVAGGRSLIDFVLASVPGRADLDRRLADAERELEEATSGATGGDGDGAYDEEELMAAAQRIADLHERIDHFERFYSEHVAHRILGGLGFEAADMERDLSELSGGWQMRAVLAGLLFQQPDLLLLDEPTNHLDLPSVAWFADFLQQYKNAFILISHDREFLNEQIRRVVSFEPEGVRMFRGNYEQYVEHRAEEEVLLEAKAKNLAREREHMQRFVDRFRAQANKAKAVQSRVKALEKMEDVELFERRKVMRFSFPPTSRTVGEVVKVRGLAKAFGDHVVFPGIDLTIRRGEKIGIIGVNGAGKTTLLRMLAGELDADAGTITLGNGVELGYYAQHHAETLDRGATVLEEVQRVAGDTSPGRVRSILGAFLFSGDDVDKPIKVLSGGERARVALAKLMVRPGNLLLMDEPTNHLDLESSESLAESLQTFDGTLVFVSHNRSLIRKLATRIWDVADGGVETYPGTLDEYIYSYRLRRRGDEEAPAEVDASPSQAAEPAPAPANDAPESDGDGGAKGTREQERERKRREAAARRRRHERVRPIERRIADLEARIAEIETSQSERSTQLSDPDVYADAARRDDLLGAYQKDADKLEELTARWENAVEELEAAEAELASNS